MERLTLQESQRYMGPIIDTIDVSPLAEKGVAWTAEADGQILGIGGLAAQWENRAIAWTLLSGDVGKYFVQLHRAVKDVLVKSPYVRIEATVDVGFEPGHRWMKMLGFEVEGYLKAYRPDGGDQIMYARIRR